MSRPLLTDDLIERYNQGESLESILRDYEARTGQTITIDELVVERMIKSRRIEKAKRQAFQSKLTKLLWLVLLLLLLLGYAIFKW